MTIHEIRESGLLESYVIGLLSDSEISKVKNAIRQYAELEKDLREIEHSLEYYARAHAVQPEPATKAMMLAMLNYTERLESGESPSNPPALHPGSKASDYAEWLDREDLQEPDQYEGMHGYIIGATPEKTTLIVWLQKGAPDETHTDEYETFLVVEGTCNIVVGDDVHALTPGDVLTIPLHVNHRVEVTSDIPCKIILERKAA